MNRDENIAIIGGHSAVAQRLRSGPALGATAFVRRDPAAGERLVADYRGIVADDLRGFDAVINCAGATSGTVDELRRANVELPLALAKACGDAGVRRLVHLSSFSTYGRASGIHQDVPPAPISAYGKTKLEGDEALLASANKDRLDVIVARFPAILEPARVVGKTANLVRLWCRLGAIPAPRGDVRRSMISATMASRILTKLARNGGRAITLAADPQPFSYRQALGAISEGAGRGLGIVWLPQLAFDPLRVLAPSLRSSMFTDSLLDARSNAASDEPSDLYHALRDLAGRIAKR